MNRDMIRHRENLRVCLLDIRTAVSDMLSYYEKYDLPGDILAEEEFPFEMSLEDLHAEIIHSINAIEVRNETMKLYKPPTMTKRDLIDALENLDCPDDAPVLAYSEVSEYLNVTEISNTDFEAGPALVIETLDNYDSRQW